MSKKRLFPLFFMIIFCVFPISAATVSFLVIESGLSMEGPENQYSGLWESGLLDVFYESGHIVSNAPRMRLEYKPTGSFPEEAKKDLDEALEGGVEYFIIALLEYQNRGENSHRPQNISVRMFKTQPLKIIYEKQFAEIKSENLGDEYSSLKQLVKGLVPNLH